MTTDTIYAGSLRPGTVIRWRDRDGEHIDEVVRAQRHGATCVMVVTRTGRTYHWGDTDEVQVLDADAAAEWQDAQARREQRERTAALLRKIADAVDAGTCDPTMVTIHTHYADQDTWSRAVEELDARELPPDASEWRAAVGEPWDATVVYLHAQRVEGQ